MSKTLDHGPEEISSNILCAYNTLAIEVHVLNASLLVKVHLLLVYCVLTHSLPMNLFIYCHVLKNE